MNKYHFFGVGLIWFLYSFGSWASNCPDPQNTSLKWGIPPAPWVVNPFSPEAPQGDEKTLFVRANILVAGFGQGVMCTYKTSTGEYSIWWQILTKIPSRSDSSWIATLGGYVCTQGLELCQFSVAAPSGTAHVILNDSDPFP